MTADNRYIIEYRVVEANIVSRNCGLGSLPLDYIPKRGRKIINNI